MGKKKRQVGHIEKFLKRANKAIDEAFEQGVNHADEILADAVEFGKLASSEAQKRSKEIRAQAKIESEKLKSKGEKKIKKTIDAARKISSTKDQDLDTLAKLGELRKAGIITDKEFKVKKKKILERI